GMRRAPGTGCVTRRIASYSADSHAAQSLDVKSSKTTGGPEAGAGAGACGAADGVAEGGGAGRKGFGMPGRIQGPGCWASASVGTRIDRATRTVSRRCVMPDLLDEGRSPRFTI